MALAVLSVTELNPRHDKKFGLLFCHPAFCNNWLQCISLIPCHPDVIAEDQKVRSSMEVKAKWRVAIGSTDGKVINEHFGRARQFLIADIARDGTVTFVENRPVTPLCQSGEHTRQGLEASIAALRDYCAVLVAQIGITAKRALELSKIAVFEEPDIIEGSLKKLADYFIRTNFEQPEE